MNAQSSSPWRGVEPVQTGARGLSSLYTRPQLEAVLHRERARADRNRCEFSLILFRVRAEDRRMTLRLARLLLRRSRGIDEIGWFDETCVAALLPYTAGDGARFFAESTLKMAQEQLIPAICRIYTYPSAWYFEDDRNNNNNSTGEGLTRSKGDIQVSGGNGNGNGNGHTKSNGNGHSQHLPHSGNGNGNGHAKSSGNGNGTGHHPTASMGTQATVLLVAEVEH